MTDSRLSRPRVVIAEPFADSGLAVLRDRGIEVISCVGAPRERLQLALAEANGLVVRSETRVDRALLAAAPKLLAVARAGVGVDAIDVPAATEAGIVVLNTPGANTLAATEQTFALMLALARHVPASNAALRAGVWDRKPYIGTELYGKTLGIVGLGRIGGNVASRAVAFGMKVIATDPFISTKRADALRVELVALDDLLGRADIVTLHVPLNKQTHGLIGTGQLASMQSHALLINCARGGVIDEAALIQALDSNAIRGAAVDVVADEPPTAGGPGARLHQHPKVVATPHLGGSTHEALERIAIELAHDLASVLTGGPATGAVNAPVADGPDADRLRPYVDVGYRLGRLYPQVSKTTALPPFTLVMEGQIADLDGEPVVRAFLAALLQTTTDRRVSIVNARAIADEVGLRVDVRSDPQATAYASSIRVIGGDRTIVGTSMYGGPRIAMLDSFEIDAIPSGAMLLTQHRDVPGMIGKVGTILGEAQINISTMQVSRNDVGGDAIMILQTDRAADSATIARLRAIHGVADVLALEI